MNIEDLRKYCLEKKGVTESFPFDETTLVFKVMGKMFALTDTKGQFSVNLKCDPEKALELRERYSSIQPGYHMNKKHWNTVYIDDCISDNILCKWIDDSYDLLIDSLSKKMKTELGKL